MKKFLALVLALVMTMSLVTISAGAEDFTDDSKITYGEAVDVMSEIGVVGGYADGSFNPTGTLTRGAAAKIICNMILGPTEASALATIEAPFKDVPADHVFAGYIAYCVSEGIVSGYSDGTFRPAGTLTGYAFWKMLLGALGYDSDIEGYTGANYAINVAKRGLNIGLDTDLEGTFSGGKALTREEACLYAFNTLLATMVEYENASTITVGDIVITNNSKAEPVLSAEAAARNFNASEVSNGQYTVQFAEKSFSNLGIAYETKYGHMNRYFTVDGQRISANKAIDKTLATSMDGTAFTKLYTKGNENYIGFEPDTIVKVYINGTLDTTADAGNDGTFAVAAEAAALKTLVDANDNLGYIIEFVDTSSPKNNKYDVVNVIEKTVYTLTADAATKEVTNNDTQVKVPGIAGMGGFSAARTVKNTFGYEGLVKGDVVLAYVSSGDMFIEKADSIEGVASGKVGGSKIIVDGTEYKQSGIANVTYSSASFADYKNTYTFYLDNAGAIVKAVKETAVADDYAYVLEGNWVAGTSLSDGNVAEARIVKMDGTVEVVKIAKINGVKTGTNPGTYDDDSEIDAAIKGNFVTYKVTDGKYELTTTDVNSTDKDGNAVTNNVGQFVAGVYGNNNTIFLVNTKTAADPKITVYTGTANVPNVLAAGNVVCAMVKDNLAKYVYIQAPAASVSGAAGEYVYFPGVKNADTGAYDLTYTFIPESEDGKGDDYVSIPAILNGVATEVKLDVLAVDNNDKDNGTTPAVTVSTKTLYKIAATDANGYIVELQPETGVVGVAYEAGVMKANTRAYNVNDNTAIYYIDVDGVVTELTYDSISSDKTDAVYVVKTDGSGNTAEKVYIQEMISANTTSVQSLKVAGTTASISGTAPTYTATGAAGAAYKLTVESAYEGTIAVTEGALEGVLPASGTVVIKWQVTAENGTTVGAEQTLTITVA